MKALASKQVRGPIVMIQYEIGPNKQLLGALPCLLYGCRCFFSVRSFLHSRQLQRLLTLIIYHNKAQTIHLMRTYTQIHTYIQTCIEWCICIHCTECVNVQSKAAKLDVHKNWSRYNHSITAAFCRYWWIGFVLVLSLSLSLRQNNAFNISSRILCIFVCVSVCVCTVVIRWG